MVLLRAGFSEGLAGKVVHSYDVQYHSGERLTHALALINATAARSPYRRGACHRRILVLPAGWAAPPGGAGRARAHLPGKAGGLQPTPEPIATRGAGQHVRRAMHP